MKRRGFLQGLGFGGMLGVIAAPAHAHAAATATEEKRNLAWARAMVAKGHRVRLEKWAHERRATIEGDAGVVTVRQGTRAGVENLDELVVTVEVLEGPWEVVPEEDYPKPPPPPAPLRRGDGGDIVLFTGDAEVGGDVFLMAGGDGSPQLTLHSAEKRRRG